MNAGVLIVAASAGALALTTRADRVRVQRAADRARAATAVPGDPDLDPPAPRRARGDARARSSSTARSGSRSSRSPPSRRRWRSACCSIGPPVMTALLGPTRASHYHRLGLALVGIGMGLHLVSGTFNQAALARGRAPGGRRLLADRRGPVRRVRRRPRDRQRGHPRRGRLLRRHRRAVRMLTFLLPPRPAALSGRAGGGRERLSTRRPDRPIRTPPIRRRAASRRRPRRPSRCPGGRRRRPRARPAPAAGARIRSSLSSEPAMNLCPPQPGSTLMHSATSSVSGATSSSAPAGVAGEIAAPAPQPASRIAASV